MTQFTRTWVESQNAKRRPAPAAPPKADARAEKELQRQILNYLRLRNFLPGCSAMHKPNTLPVGHPDIWFSYYGLSVYLEVKTAQGRLTKEQADYAIRLQSEPNLARWRLVRSLDEVRQLLDEIERGR